MLLLVGIICSLIEIRKMIIEKNVKCLLYLFIIFISILIFININDIKSMGEIIKIIKEKINEFN